MLCTTCLRWLRLCMLTVMALAGGVGVADAGDCDMVVMAEPYAPMSYEEQGVPKGVLVDVVQEMLQRMGKADCAVSFFPWHRAYANLQQKPRHVLFPFNRTPEREGRFHFVGPVFSENEVFWKLKGRTLPVRSLDDARNVQRIAVVKDDYYHLTLQEQGFANLDVSYDHKQNFIKLQLARVDLIPLGEYTGAIFARDNGGIRPEDVEPVPVSFARSETFLGFSQDFEKDEIAAWQRAFESLVKDGTYKRIVGQYLPNVQ